MPASSTQTPLPRPATFQDLLAVPEDERFHEILDGELTRKLMPSARHGLGQGALQAWLFQRFSRKPNGAQRPGGWWILPEVEVQLSMHQVVRPDVSGWRRERMPELIEAYPMKLRPDWVCEVLTDSNGRRRDGVQKRRIYADAGVPHYWILDAEQQSLSVLRLTDAGYVEIAQARAGDRVRLEPFDSVELPVAILFGEDAE
jgi:Uma2 family endonuclease